MKSFGLLLFTVLYLAPLGVWAQANPWPSDLARKLSRQVDHEVDRTGDKFRASLFEQLTEIEHRFFQRNGVSASVRVRRQVFDNQDILNSWTVVDHFDIPVTLPLQVIDPVALGTGGALSLNLGLRISMNSMHIRQVLPQEHSRLPSLDQLRAHWENLDEAEDDEELRADVVFSDEDIEQRDFMENLFQFVTFDRENPRTRARYSRLSNLFLSPMGLPLTPKRAEAMPNGEIRSFSLDGAVQFGPSVGWGQVELPLVGDSGVSTGITTYVRGQWRLSVMKEEDHTVQVKLTRDHGTGLQAHLGGRSADHVLLDGFVVLGQRVGRLRASVIPFNLAVSKDHTKSFEVGYRYDLRDERARKAYAQAMVGRFGASDKLATLNDGAVAQTFTREQDETRRRRTYQMRLSLFYERLNTSGVTDTVAEITLDGREYHIFRSQSESTQSTDSIIGLTTLKSMRFITELNEEDYLSGEGGLSLRLEGRLEDSRTTSRDYLNAIAAVEHVTGLVDFFPRIPKFTPEAQARPECSDPTPAQIRDLRRRRQSCPAETFVNLKDSSFFFQVSYSREQIEEFLHLREEDMWSLLEQGFGIKEGSWSDTQSRFFYGLQRSAATALNPALAFVDLHLKSGYALYSAQRFMRQWRELKMVRHDPEALVRGMAHLFSTRYFSYELAQVLKLAFSEQARGVFVQARAQNFFGQLSYLNGDFDPVDHISHRADRVINFDQPGPRPRVDTEARIEKFSIRYLGDNTAEVRFTFPKTPSLIYLRVDRTPNWGRFRNLLTSLVHNRGEFSEGENVMIINREGEEGLRATLAQLLFSGEILTFSFAISVDGQNWGGMTQQRLRTQD
jgi:hypothetical protein